MLCGKISFLILSRKLERQPMPFLEKCLKPSRIPIISPGLPGGEATVTFVVHVGGQLNAAHGDIHPQVAEVRVRFEKKLSSQLHVVALVILLID